ncbi:TPA: VENN motif pre-toxin domain-containing protein [Mannheimia haemolytica]
MLSILQIPAVNQPLVLARVKHSRHRGVSAAGDYKGGWNGQRVDKEGKPTHSLSNAIGYGKDQDSQSSQTTFGINTQNLIIRDEQAQLEKTAKTAAQIKEDIKTDITTETAESRSGKLENNFDKEKLQKELDYQVKSIQDFQAVTVATINEKVATHAESKRTEAEQAKAAGNTTKARELEQEAEKWETGGAYRQGVDAVTNAVGLALGGSPTAGVVTGAISPYINTQIKRETEDNAEANLIAHALWGAVEAYSQGGKAGAGAVAAVTGEVGANIISQNLFGKEPENLTEAEKRTVSELSQVAAGLAGGLASSSGSSLSTAQAVKTGQGIGKNAVENNFLSQSEYAELERLMKKKILTQEESIRVQHLLEKDKVSDRLLHIYKTQPESLSQEGRDLLLKWVKEYGNIPQQIQLLNTPANSSVMKPDYSDLKLEAQKVYNYSGSVQGRLSESLNTGVSVVGTGGNSLVIKGVQYASICS